MLLAVYGARSDARNSDRCGIGIGEGAEAVCASDEAFMLMAVLDVACMQARASMLIIR